MPNKFDTNPLDPEFPRKAAAAPSETQPTLNLPGNYDTETRRFDDPANTEERTRRFDEANFNSYQMPPVTPPARPEPRSFVELDADPTRKVDKVGLPENVLTALPYIPWYIGLVAGLLILLFVPRSETKVRFHAAQGLAAHVAILIVTSILKTIGNFTDAAQWGNVVFGLVTMVMLIIFAVKAYQGKPVHIESVDDLTNWLEEKIKPKN